METEVLKKFVGKKVKIEYKNGFILRGEILELYEDSLYFKSQQAESVISISDIKNVITLDGDCYDSS